MALRKGLPAKLALTDADDTRYDLAGLIACNADGTPRGGVLSPVGANLVTATSTMNVSVARFQGAAVRDGGVVLLANDGPTSVLLDAAPAANSRIDVIFAKQNDASSTVSVPDANNLPVLGFVKGTAGAVPVKPSIPVGALELATVQIPSTATATNSSGVVITQTAQFTAASNGLVPVRSDAERDAFVCSRGQQVRNLADDSTATWDGSRWLVFDSKPQSHAATFVNFAPGNSVIQATYTRRGKTVRCEGSVNVGSTSTIGSQPTLVLPFAGIAKYAASGTNYVLGTSGMLDRGTGYYSGPVMTQANASQAIIGAFASAGGRYQAINPTYPFTWAINDEFSWMFEYEIA